MENLTELYNELKALYQNLASTHMRIALAQCDKKDPYLVHNNVMASMRFGKIKQNIEAGKVIY